MIRQNKRTTVANTAAIIFVLTLSMFGGALQAQLLTKKALTLEAAGKIMQAAKAEAMRQSFPATIAIVDEGGYLLMLERLDDWQVASVEVAIGKARTAAIFRRPTSAFEDIIKNGRTPMIALDDFTPLQGGVPIMYEGRVIGAIGISGNNPPRDEEIAKVGADALAGATTMMSSPTVTFFDKKEVEAAFASGSVLLDGNGRNYMIHASRRDKPGMAEVHSGEADVIYVMDGKATFVTGGTVVDGRETAPGELRGSAIKDGEVRQLVKGDVIVVPDGVPHWFKEVSNPFLYYVVKVR